MTEFKNKKLNMLLSGWPPGAVYTTSWLKKRGYGSDLLSRYKQSGWISSFGRGAFVRFDETPEWEGGLYALQQQLALPVHVGGITSLQLQGVGHFISPGLKHCHLYTTKKQKLPFWFRKANWKVNMNLHISTLFGDTGAGIKQITYHQIPIRIAAPERAILEMLSHVSSQASFIHAWQNMEALPALRPVLMQKLLEQCHSIKVVRLCLYMADKHQLQWFRRLDIKKFDLGSGKRSVVNPGQLDEKYQITVPKQLEEDSWT